MSAATADETTLINQRRKQRLNIPVFFIWGARPLGGTRIFNRGWAARLNINNALFFCTACLQSMDTFVKGQPGKLKAADESTPNITTTKIKTRKYDKVYLAVGFTSITVGNEERLQCVVSQNISFWTSSDAMLEAAA